MPQQHSRAAAGDAHRRLHMTRGQRKFWSGCEISPTYTVMNLLQTHTRTHTHTRLMALFSGTTLVSRYQKNKTSLDFTEARDSEWQVCTSLQADNHASTPPLSFLQAECPSSAQPTASKH